MELIYHSSLTKIYTLREYKMKNPSILIVEDEALTATFLELKFKGENYNVVKIVSTADEAIKAALEFKPDFIIMDIRLEGKLDGIDAATEILKHYKPIIIFVSGYEKDRLLNRLEDIEYLAYLSKPVEFKTILDLLKKVVQK